jgi:cysteine-rich repeat protein
MLDHTCLRLLPTCTSLLSVLILGACPAPTPSGSSTGTGTGTSTDSGTDTTDTDTTGTDTGTEMCGNGELDPGEMCDDGNDDNFDSCTELCQPPSCDDGIWSTGETDLDCGGICDAVCADGLTCNQDDDCVSACADGACVTALSCADLLARAPDSASTGLHDIDPDGDDGPIEPYMVHCEMGEFLQTDLDGGGWTLVMSVADDGADTFTWNNREIFTTDTTTFGEPFEYMMADFKGATYHDLPFTDLLFFHTPSADYATSATGRRPSPSSWRRSPL